MYQLFQNKMKAITNTLLFLFCFISCSQEKYKIRLDSLSDIKKGVSYSLDSVVYKVDTVYLETTDSCLIDGISSIKEMDGYYYITSEKNQALYKFRKDGRFISKIGTRGQGPGEYISLRQIELDHDNKWIYNLDYFGCHMLVFDSNGNYLKSYDLPSEYDYNTFALRDDGIYYFSCYNSVIPNITFFDFNTQSFETCSKAERTMYKGEPYLGETFLFQYHNKLCFYHYFNDTIFSINNKKLSFEDILYLGKHQFSFEDVKNILNLNGSRIQIMKISSLDDYIFFFYAVSQYDGKNRKNLTAMKYKDLFIPNVHLTSELYPEIKEGEYFFAENSSSSIIKCIYPSDLDEDFLQKQNISAEDNPILFVYNFQTLK